MRKFLIKLLFALSLSVIVFGFLCLFVKLVQTRNNYKILPDQSTLILGDSQGEQNCNDSILDNTFNFSFNAETFFETYIKLKVLKQQNSHINRLVLIVTPLNVSKGSDFRYLRNRNIFWQTLPYINFEEFRTIFKIVSHEPKILINDRFSKLHGGYVPLNGCYLQEDLRKNHFANELNSYYDNTNQLFYLNEIVEFCKHQNIRLFFLNTPVYKGKIFLIQHTIIL